MKLPLALPAAAAVLAIALTGCSADPAATSTPGSGSAPSTAASGAVFADADVVFLQMMSPHHAQAVEMADLVRGRTQNRAVIDLAARISAEQGPEMTRMTDLLASFGTPTPSADSSTTGGMAMSGMMTPQDVASLAAASGAQFDRQWLTMMVAHHTGALEMANTELATGTNPDTRQLAAGIIAAQQAEIDTMNGLLATS